MSDILPVPVPEEQIAAFCRRHHIRRLSLFGSVLREDFTPDSDIDVLVEFAPQDTPGLIGLITMQDELEALFGRRVDLLTPKFIHHSIRQHVVNEAQVIYDAA